MLGLGFVAAMALSQSQPMTVNDELRRARNEYAYGAYEGAVKRLRGLLYPLRLYSDEQVIEARQYLALAYYLQGNEKGVREEFAKLLYLDPDYELDPFTVAPTIIELFEGIRLTLKPELDVIRLRRNIQKIEEPGKAGYVRNIETTVIERSEWATFMPFGIGQFQNGDRGWGAFFATTQLLLLAANISTYLIASRINDYRPDQAGLRQALVVTQYATGALFGFAWTMGVFHARLNFVPRYELPLKTITEEPLPAVGFGGAMQFQLDF